MEPESEPGDKTERLHDGAQTQNDLCDDMNRKSQVVFGFLAELSRRTAHSRLRPLVAALRAAIEERDKILDKYLDNERKNNQLAREVLENGMETMRNKMQKKMDKKMLEMSENFITMNAWTPLCFFATGVVVTILSNLIYSNMTFGSSLFAGLVACVIPSSGSIFSGVRHGVNYMRSFFVRPNPVLIAEGS